ncbi:MAG: aminoacyl-tRNA hydrolase [bacterium]
MYLVVGLGNPGERYTRTRHNVAWWVLDALAARHAATEGPSDPTYRVRHCRIAGHELALLQPLTFMNRSGEALAAWRARQGMEQGLLVLSDDVYLPLGAMRVRESGSSGGHRGLESIETAFGGREYARLRIGVGAAESAAALKQHVLEEFAPEEMPALEDVVRRSADCIEVWVAEGALGAMNRFNRRVRQKETET